MNLVGRRLVLTRLAELLPEEWLRRWFPGREPDDLRALLRQAAALEDDRDRTPSPSAMKDPSAAHPVEDADADVPCVLFSDGASRGNPGPAGAGWVILDAQGRERTAGGSYLGHHTNNVAEYLALRSGLREAVRLGCRHLDIRLDSELIVRQLQGRYQVKHPALKPLYRDVRELLDSFADWQVRHIPRSLNSRADSLANQGIDTRAP